MGLGSTEDRANSKDGGKKKVAERQRIFAGRMIRSEAATAKGIELDRPFMDATASDDSGYPATGLCE